MKGHRKYKEEEIVYIEANWGSKSIKSIAKKLNRTECAIKIKAHKLGLGDPLNHVDFLILRDVAEILGVDRKTVSGYIKNKNLPAKEMHLDKRRIIAIKYNSLLDWLMDNIDKWDGAKVDKLALESLGFNKDILERKVEEDIKNKESKTLTESDIEEIKRLYSQFIQYKEIADRLGKTFNTVKEKIFYLISTGELEANSYKNRLVRNIDRSGYGWTKWQDEMLIREFKNGKTLREISEMVGKSLAATKTRNQTLTKRIIQGLEI